VIAGVNVPPELYVPTLCCTCNDDETRERVCRKLFRGCEIGGMNVPTVLKHVLTVVGVFPGENNDFVADGDLFELQTIIEPIKNDLRQTTIL
jgi:hypothetical protein